MVHPLMAGPAAVFAWWDGRQALHGGAFANDAGAWVLLAEKGGGKSTTLAALARAGATIMADDLVVIEALTAMGGPRCIDLTPHAAAQLDVAVRSSGDARADKLRLSLEAAPAELPLAGFVHLDWGAETASVPVPPTERPARLLQHLMLWPSAVGVGNLLDLVALPTYEVRRRREPGSLDAVTQLLLALGG